MPSSQHSAFLKPRICLWQWRREFLSSFLLGLRDEDRTAHPSSGYSLSGHLSSPRRMGWQGKMNYLLSDNVSWLSIRIKLITSLTFQIICPPAQSPEGTALPPTLNHSMASISRFSFLKHSAPSRLKRQLEAYTSSAEIYLFYGSSHFQISLPLF